MSHYGSNVSVESTSLIGRKKSPSLTRLNNINDRRWLRRWWMVHFSLSVAVLVAGMIRNLNPTKKYLKVNPSLVVSDQLCTSAYLNVYAASSKEPDATICCTAVDSSDSNSPMNEDNEYCSSLFSYSQVLLQQIRNFSKLQSSICTSKSQKLPFVGRLAKFPDAWILPLFPLLFRAMFSLLAAIMKFIFKSITTGSLKFNAYSTKSMKHSVRRLCCYFILMNFRGWVLYLCLNQIEDQFVADFSSGAHLTFLIISCYITHKFLPIALFETLHIGIEYPKWFTDGDPEHAIRQTRSITTMRRYINHSFRRFVSMILFGSHVYLQIITSFGAYKTSGLLPYSIRNNSRFLY